MVKLYRYVVMSDELSVEQKIVQVAHACLISKPQHAEHTINVVVCSVDTFDDLRGLGFALLEKDILFDAMVDMLYHGTDITALVTEPVSADSYKRLWLQENTTKYVFK